MVGLRVSSEVGREMSPGEKRQPTRLSQQIEQQIEETQAWSGLGGWLWLGVDGRMEPLRMKAGTQAGGGLGRRRRQ